LALSKCFSGQHPSTN